MNITGVGDKILSITPNDFNSYAVFFFSVILSLITIYFIIRGKKVLNLRLDLLNEIYEIAKKDNDRGQLLYLLYHNSKTYNQMLYSFKSLKKIEKNIRKIMGLKQVGGKK